MILCVHPPLELRDGSFHEVCSSLRGNSQLFFNDEVRPFPIVDNPDFLPVYFIFIHVHLFCRFLITVTYEFTLEEFLRFI